MTVIDHDDVIAVLRSAPTGRVRWPGDPADAEQFRRAGWDLVPRSEGRTGAVTALVLERPGGHLALAPNRVVVKFEDALTSPQVDALLEQRNCRTLLELRFATNLRLVERVTADAVVDAIGLANELREADGCEFAEPELIEPTGVRPLVTSAASGDGGQPSVGTRPTAHAVQLTELGREHLMRTPKR